MSVNNTNNLLDMDNVQLIEVFQKALVILSKAYGERSTEEDEWVEKEPHVLRLLDGDVEGSPEQLDSGAEISVIDRKLCINNNWSINYINGKIKYAGSGDQRARIGTCGPLKISYNNHKPMFTFEVMDLECEEMIIGKDLMPHIGLAITGIAVKWDDMENNSVKNNNPIDPDQELNTDHPVGTPDQRNNFFKEVQPLLDQNAKIPLSLYCPLEESIIELPTSEGPPSFQRQYPHPYHLRPVIDETVKKWLDDGVIVRAPVNTTWNSPLTITDKRNSQGEVTGKRICLDVRLLNNRLLTNDKHPLPLIKDIFDDLAGSTVFTTIDLSSAYHRFRIKKEFQDRTAFTHNNNQFVFQACPFGLKPIASRFQRVMSRIFYDMPFVRCYIDDIVIKSKSIESHKDHVIQVIKALSKNNMIINHKKSKFMQTQIYLLGFRISQHGRQIERSKITNVLNWPIPKTGKQIEKLLGTVNFLRDFLPNASKMCAKLDSLRKLGSLHNVWNNEHLQSFNMIKRALAYNVLLEFPNMNEPMYVATDASLFGIAACLFQRINGKDHYISFMARALNKSERNYSATKRELLAVVFALTKFHTYLWAHPFTLYTDCKALTYLHTQRIANPMMINWFDIILNYTFNVVHLPGLQNVLPDNLSRLFTPSEPLEGGSDIKITALRKSTSDNPHVFKMTNRKTPKDMMTPPDTDRKAELEAAHLKVGHAGAEHIVRYLQYYQGLSWGSILQDAVKTVSSCPECMKYNIAKKGYNPLRPVYAYIPGDAWGMDLASFNKTSTSGNNYLFLMVDLCTRFVILRALPNKQSNTIVKAVLDVISTFGICRSIQHDNGREFKNFPMKKLCESLGIEERFSTPWHPRGNGASEAYIKNAIHLLRKKIKGAANDWDYYVPSTQLEINTRVSKRLKTPPFSLMFARKINEYRDYRLDNSTPQKPLSEEELIKKIENMENIVFPAMQQRAKEYVTKQKETFDKTHKIVEFPEQSHVMAKVHLRDSKLAPLFEGPYKVLRKTQGGTYILQDEQGILMPRNYAPSELKLISQDEVIPADELYEIESIIKHKGQPGNREYLVRWKGYEPKDDSWLKPEKFTDPDFIIKYWHRLGQNEKEINKINKNDNKRKRSNTMSPNHNNNNDNNYLRRSKRLKH